MNSQKAWGTILTLIGLAGMVYCFIGIVDDGMKKNPLVGVIMIATFSFICGVSMLRHLLENGTVAND